MIESFLGLLERRKKKHMWRCPRLEEWTLARHNLEIVRQAVANAFCGPVKQFFASRPGHGNECGMDS